jgi:hypothetical protein
MVMVQELGLRLEQHLDISLLAEKIGVPGLVSHGGRVTFPWHKSAFVVSPWNVPVTIVPDFIDTLFIQVAWGTGYPSPSISPEKLQQLRSYFKIGAWAWCEGDQVEIEAAHHARTAKAFQAEAFIANMEAEYDAHGNSSDPKFKMPTQYLNVLKKTIGDMPLGLTTTPRFGSHMSDWQSAGAIYMPQSFNLEARITLPEAIQHAKDWGWQTPQIRPLVQTYSTNGFWIDGAGINNEASAAGVGVIPYTIEQATTSGAVGMKVLTDLRESIIRPNAAGPTPSPPEEDMQLIGSQHGIVAAYNRMKAIDPGGCNPKFDPNNYNALPIDQLKAWDKWARTMMILREDHDEAVS